MNWLKKLFFKRKMNKSLDGQLKVLDPEKFIPISPPYSGAGQTDGDVSITEQYSLLGNEIDKAIDAKRDARDAAVRVTTSIGAAPSSPTPGPDRGIKLTRK